MRVDDLAVMLYVRRDYKGAVSRYKAPHKIADENFSPVLGLDHFYLYSELLTGRMELFDSQFFIASAS